MLCQAAEADSSSHLVFDEDEMAKSFGKGKRKRSFGRRLSENALRNWGSVAGNEVVVYCEDLKHDDDDGYGSFDVESSSSNVPMFPSLCEGILVQEAVQPEITHPAGYINCANFKPAAPVLVTRRTRAKSRAKRRPNTLARETPATARAPEFLPDVWFALGMHKRTPIVVLNKLEVKVSGSTQGEGEETKEKELCVKDKDKEFEDAVAETEEAIAKIESEFFSDHFDDLNVNIQDASFTTFVDAINTDFTPEDLKDSTILDSTNLFYALLGIKEKETDPVD